MLTVCLKDFSVSVASIFQHFGKFSSFFFFFFFLRSKSVNLVGQYCVSQSKKESSMSPGEMAAAQVDADPEKRRMEGENMQTPHRKVLPQPGIKPRTLL